MEDYHTDRTNKTGSLSNQEDSSKNLTDFPKYFFNFFSATCASNSSYMKFKF